MTSQCNGICRTAYEVGIPQPGIAIAHPDCEEHGETPDRGDGQGWVVQPPPVAARAGRSPQPVSGSLSPRPPQGTGAVPRLGTLPAPWAWGPLLVWAAVAVMALVWLLGGGA